MKKVSILLVITNNRQVFKIIEEDIQDRGVSRTLAGFAVTFSETSWENWVTSLSCAEQNKVTNQTTRAHVELVTGILLISAQQKIVQQCSAQQQH